MANPYPDVSDFRSGVRGDAWWIAYLATGTRVCRSTGRTLLRRALKATYPLPLQWLHSWTGTHRSGAWTAADTARLYAMLRNRGWPTSQIPFRPDEPTITRDLLRVLIWLAEHEQQLGWTDVDLPSTWVAPALGQPPQDDGAGDTLPDAQCEYLRGEAPAMSDAPSPGPPTFEPAPTPPRELAPTRGDATAWLPPFLGVVAASAVVVGGGAYLLSRYAARPAKRRTPR